MKADIEVTYTTDDLTYKTMASLGDAEDLAFLEWTTNNSQIKFMAKTKGKYIATTKAVTIKIKNTKHNKSVYVNFTYVEYAAPSSGKFWVHSTSDARH